MKSFIVALFCISSAFADVSELFHQHDPLAQHRHQDPQPYDLNEEHQPPTLETVFHVEEPTAIEFSLENDGFVEIVEVQLSEAHADYQGPYHYEKPKVQLEYEIPAPVPVVPDEAPSSKDQPNIYLPPINSGDNLVKRHAKYIVGRRV